MSDELNLHQEHEEVAYEREDLSPRGIFAFLIGLALVAINDFRLQEEKKLNSYGWIDQKAGIARIPIDRAMQLLAQRGLPTRLQAGAVPPSPVNMARQAVTRSNTSQQPKTSRKRKEVKQ